MFHDFNPQDGQSYTDPRALLAAVLAHPHGQELARLVDRLHQDSQSQTQQDIRLVAIALNLAERQGIKDKPYFKSMANDEIRRWIAQHSPKQEIS
ncbi:MAG: hypothetical protein HC786_20125 [Richelia sp. CSU_2_1]|nr:hypothetical protein [Microcoleus sp. SM1_3_4]NJR24288.1 hypothetical protein [Richelia sp. CSU_2_1]